MAREKGTGKKAGAGLSKLSKKTVENRTKDALGDKKKKKTKEQKKTAPAAGVVAKRHAKKEEKLGVSKNAVHELASAAGIARIADDCLLVAKEDLETKFLPRLVQDMVTLTKTAKTMKLKTLKNAMRQMGVTITGFDTESKGNAHVLPRQRPRIEGEARKLLKASEEPK